MLSRFHPIPGRYGQRDGRTDGQTDRIAISISRVSMLTRDKNECKAVKLCGTDIPYESSTRYLGVFLCAAKQFKMSIKQARASFYKSLNDKSTPE